MSKTKKEKSRNERLDYIKEIWKDEEFRKLVFKALRIILETLTEK